MQKSRTGSEIRDQLPLLNQHTMIFNTAVGKSNLAKLIEEIKKAI